MDPAQALADQESARGKKATATAPEAAAWIANPDEPAAARTAAQLLTDEIQRGEIWKGGE